MSALKLEHKATEKFVENLMLRFLVLAALSCFGSFVTTDVNAAEPAWGPAIGARVDISALDDAGRERTLADLSGEKGLLLFLNRSADW